MHTFLAPLRLEAILLLLICKVTQGPALCLPSPTARLVGRGTLLHASHSLGRGPWLYPITTWLIFGLLSERIILFVAVDSVCLWKTSSEASYNTILNQTVPDYFQYRVLHCIKFHQCGWILKYPLKKPLGATFISFIRRLCFPYRMVSEIRYTKETGGDWAA